MNLPYRLRHLFRRRDTEAEMAEEMRFHLEQRAADLADDGLSEQEAHYAAQRKFGNLGSIQEQARETGGWGWLDRLTKDFQLGLRQLMRSPRFTLLAIVTLGLGVGANTSMFSVLNAMLLRPLPYPDSRQLERIDRVTPQNAEGRVSPADFFQFQRESAAYGEVAANALGDLSLSEQGQPPELARALRITPNYFSVLRVQPALGRSFRDAEAQSGNDRVLIISHRCWQTRFGGRPDIVGHTVRVDGQPHEIVGVLGEHANDFRYLGWVDLFRPLALEPQKANDRQTLMLRMLARRSEKLSAEEGAAFVAGFGGRLAADHPEVNAGSSWRTVALSRAVAGRDGPVMVSMLLGLSGFVLLIACSNLANLLLARTMASAREFAVRAALGASRVQLLRPLFAEAVLLALGGGLCALLVALWTNDWLTSRTTDDFGQHMPILVDWRVLGWAAAVALVTAIAFGLAPAFFALRLDVNRTLKSGGRNMTGGRGHQFFRHALVVGQFCLAMTLLAGATLYVRALIELNGQRAGWQSAQLVRGTVVLPAGNYPDTERIAGFQRLAIERLEALPGVASVSLSSSTPFFPFGEVRKYLVHGGPAPAPGQEPAANLNLVSPRYFETVGTRLITGRVFTERDSLAAPRVFILSQTTATALFGNENPIGRRIARAGTQSPQWGEIVGVVVDVTSVDSDPGPVALQVYEPLAQEPRAQNEIIVRAAAGVAPPMLLDRIRAAMAELDRDLPVRQLQPADTAIERSNYQLGVLRDILFLFAALGLGLAAMGVYGVITRTMAQRTNEFAIRLALGAHARDISCLVLRSGVRLALLGAALGILGAIGVTHLLAAGLPAMRLDSPLLLSAAAFFLIGIALLASWLPARRAASVNPIDALRAE